MASTIPFAETPTAVLSVSPPPHDPPPPYPSPDRRTRPRRSTRRRRTFDDGQYYAHAQTSSAGSELDADPAPAQDLSAYDEHDASETTPLLFASPSSTAPGNGIGRRQRTLSLTSTLRSTVSPAPSFVHTILSAFHPERDDDLDPCAAEERQGDGESESADSPPRPSVSLEDQRAFVADLAGQSLRQRAAGLSWGARWRRYFRPLRIRAYYAALFHLLVLNLPYALLAWVYLFVFTVTGTTTLMALPLGAVLCFLDLIGARILARGELALQTTFHGPLAYPSPVPPLPIFTRLRPLTPADPEAAPAPARAVVSDHSFYRNAYALFTDPTSYQALFYFLVIKPGITFLLSLLLVVLVPVATVLVLPAPAAWRLARRLGIWQANVAVEGLYYSHAR